jgi:hypothetical protein
MKRYITLGFATVLALSLAVPALGGPSNPVASSAVSLTGVLKKAKKAKQAAAAAQATANSALGTANSAQGTANSAQGAASNAQSAANAAQADADSAQTTANNALAETADVSADDLDTSIDFTDSASDSTTPKTVSETCPAGTEAIAITGAVNQTVLPPDEVTFDGGTGFYGLHVAAHENTAFAGNWFLSITATCIDSTG